MENINILQNLPLFQELSRLELIQINKVVQARRFAAGEIVIAESDSPDNMYIIKSGSVIVYIEGTENRKEVLATLGVGDHFGEMALIDNGPRSASVEASEDTEVLFINSQEFRNLIDTDTELKIKVYEAFLRTLCGRLRATNDTAIIYRIQANIQNET